MDIKMIQEELQKLTTLVSGWSAFAEITAVERDLALEKLRRVYETVRFADGEMPVAVAREPEDEGEVEIAESINLDEVLFETSAAVSSVTEEAIVAAPVPQIIAEPDIPAAPSEPEVVKPAATPEIKAEKADEPVLFGVDELVQHRRKQRVIMSLYDDSSEQSVTAASKEELTVPALREEPVLQSETQVFVLEEVSAEDDIPEYEELLVETMPMPEGQELPNEEEQEEEATAEACKSDAVPEKVVASPTDIPTDTPADIPTDTPADDAGAVLGEVINRGVHTLGETLAGAHDTISEIAHRAHVTNLRQAIGINDKFLLIRDLFEGDAAAYDKTIDTLNEFDDLDDCMIHIAEHYAWNPNSDGAKLIVELLERKLV